jgi:hypothetical protein
MANANSQTENGVSGTVSFCGLLQGACDIRYLVGLDFAGRYLESCGWPTQPDG